MKRTPLYEAHRKAGARLIEFGGWEMPVQYTSITDEHLNVRNAAGIFDISHMGEFLVRGAGAGASLNRALTNDIRKLTAGQGQYTLMCNERGGVVDDLYAYRLGPEEYLLIVNASRIEADFAWLQHALAAEDSPAVLLENASERLGAVAIQGPKVAEFIDLCFPGPSVRGAEVERVSGLQKNQLGSVRFRGEEIWVGRTGYTGEDGFEVVTPGDTIETVWNCALEIGGKFGLKPAGLGARDTLRTEMCYPLYGHELDENTTPIEAGLGFFVALDKGEFTGREVLAAQKSGGTRKKLAAVKMTDKSAPPRPGYPVWSTGRQPAPLGQIVSGTQSPSLGVGVGLAYVPPEFAKPQTPLEIEIRGRYSPAVVVPRPIYRKPN
jgi:aminomethyltransferase